jgi:hypothetical protein
MTAGGLVLAVWSCPRCATPTQSVRRPHLCRRACARATARARACARARAGVARYASLPGRSRCKFAFLDTVCGLATAHLLLR